MSFLNFILSQRRFVYKTILVFVLFSIAFLFFEQNGKASKNKILELRKHKRVLCFLIYASYLITATVIGRYLKNPYTCIFYGIGFRPYDPTWNRDILNNIILFVPYTFLYLEAFSTDKPFMTAFIVSFFTTLFIELSQLIGWLGSFQFADIFHNLIGGIMGYGLWIAVRKVRGQKNE